MSLPPIAPDTKDWTWTAQRACAECGFDASAIRVEGLGSQVLALTTPWQYVLAGSDVAQRPEPTTWSPLEYACHIHEVLDVFAERFALILRKDNPTLPNWDQDDAAVAGQYAAQAPARLAREIPGRAAALVAVLGRFAELAWERRALRSDGAQFTALTLARYLLHDLAHHLHDVGVAVPVETAVDD